MPRVKPRILHFFALALLLAMVACGGTERAQSPAPAAPAKPAVPADVQGAIAAALGSDAEVLVYGDLAKTGQLQALGINRIQKRMEDTVPGTLLMRASLVSKDGEQWKELLRVDEHLKNNNGFLAATPVSPVNGWRLQYEQDAEKGLILYFTPIQQPVAGYRTTIGVRWNPKVKRYQSLDREYRVFLGEAPALERLSSYLK